MITSKTNELIKKCIQIKQKKYSKLERLCLVESIKLVRELASKKLLTTILVTNDKFSQVKDLGVKIETISESIASYISDTVTTDGVFAICKVPNSEIKEFNRCLILDRIQDPSNLGAILRSAVAFGFKTIFTLNSVYPYSCKAIRSSMGYVFDVNFLEVDINSLKSIKSKNNLTILSANMNGDLIENVEVNEVGNLAIIIGNEGQGVDKALSQLSDKTISIEMKNNVESLNASVSAGILMYYLR